MAMKSKVIVRCLFLIPMAIGCFYSLWLLLRVFIFDVFVIPSDSMLPTLQPGDKVLVNKTLLGARIYTDFHFDKKGGVLHSFRTNGLRNVRRNDIVVFNMPYIDGHIKFKINYVYCKRCVALPGDSVSVVDGYYRNNNDDGILGVEAEQYALKQMPDSLIPDFVMNTMPYDVHFPWTIKNFGPLYLPRKEELIKITPREAVLYKSLIEWESHEKLCVDWQRNIVKLGKNQLRKYRFKHDYYFLVGDHVVNSQDARYLGMIPDDYIVGIVSKILRKK